MVNGRLDRRGDVDTFAVRLDQGQTLVAEIEAQRVLASPLDAVVEIVSSTGFVLARNDDDQGIDPRILFIAPQTGVYLVRTFGFPAAPDSSIALAGGDAFLYRLTVTVGGFLDYTLPLAVASPTQQVQPAGWNLPTEIQYLTPVALPEPNRVAVVHPRLGNMLVLPVTSHPSILAREPSEAGKPQRIELPITITGRLEKPRDRDTFRFTAHKGETIDFRIESRTLGYPLDPVLEIFDGQGKSLVRVDDSADGRDAQLAFAVPADGEYDFAVTDLHRQGGPRFVYRLTAVMARPDVCALDWWRCVRCAGRPEARIAGGSRTAARICRVDQPPRGRGAAGSKCGTGGVACGGGFGQSSEVSDHGRCQPICRSDPYQRNGSQRRSRCACRAGNDSRPQSQDERRMVDRHRCGKEVSRQLAALMKPHANASPTTHLTFTERTSDRCALGQRSAGMDTRSDSIFTVTALFGGIVRFTVWLFRSPPISRHIAAR